VRRIEIYPIKEAEFPEIARVYRQSRHFLVDISGEPAQNAGLLGVQKEAAEAKVHGAVFAAVRLIESCEIVGVVTYVGHGYKGDPAQAWIALLMISEPQQSRGFGKEAYDLVEGIIFADSQVDIITLGVLSHNTAAMIFWKKMGFRAAETRKPDPHGHEVIVMEKRCSPTLSV
jgi:ribosomal protein S18 acetylase RimI-like enzyme